MKIQETITALKKMSDHLYKDGYLYYSYVCDEAVSIFDELIAENERLKSNSENNPLTLEEVKELKEGDMVWLKDEYGIQTVEFSRIDNAKYGAYIYYFMFDVAGIECHDLDYLNQTYFIYCNKPDIADVSKKEEQK